MRSARRVVVTGLGIVSPVGNDIATAWANVLAGRSGIGPITNFDCSAFATRFAGQVRDFDVTQWVPMKDARRMDPFIHYGIAAGIQAVRDAGFETVPESLRGRFGAAVAAGIGGISTIEKTTLAWHEGGPRKISPFFVPGTIINMVAGHLAIMLGLKGPNLSIVTACTTATHNIGVAARLIAYGDADVMIAGGAEHATTPTAVGGFISSRALSERNDDPTRASRPWDKDRDGFVLSDGAGTLVLEEYEHARQRGARIYAELVGFGMSDDAYHMTAPTEDGAGAASAMIAAMADAGLNAEQVQYVNAHATSTPLGDRAEIVAIKRAFGSAVDRLMVSSTKSATGHLLGAAGGIEAIFSVLALRDQVVPPTINLDHPDEGCDLDLVPHTARQTPLDIVMSNSFGFGGTNGTLIFKRVWSGLRGRGEPRAPADGHRAAYLPDTRTSMSIDARQWPQSAGHLAALRRALGARAPVLLSSAASGPQAQHDLLPLVAGAPLVVPYPGEPEHDERLHALQQQLTAMTVGQGDASERPLASGWLLYLAYDFAQVFEPGVPMHRPALPEPLALLWRIPACISHHHATGVSTADGDSDYLDAALRMPINPVLPAAAPHWTVVEDDPHRFLNGVERIHAYLRAGDVFQVNLSRAWTADSPTPIDLDALYARLCRTNPAPFAALLQHEGWGLASSSPERLVSVRGARVETRPIAGTRRRDVDPTSDAALLAELRRDPKERAEHIMLIDLERNDLGRVCVPGSVRVDELGVIESYAHVHHLVSNVSGELRPGTSAWSLLRAVFPGGTITGCPKVRCMQIISELEGVGRGAYTGALGYIGDDGNVDFNILIRTFSVCGRRAVFRAGAGIVADSVAARELLETRAKAKGLLRALESGA